MYNRTKHIILLSDSDKYLHFRYVKPGMIQDYKVTEKLRINC